MPSDFRKIVATLSVPEVVVASEKELKTWAWWLFFWHDRNCWTKEAYPPEYCEEPLDENEVNVLIPLLSIDGHCSEEELLAGAELLLKHGRVLREYAAIPAGKEVIS